jgi:hypothetical protein
MTTAIIIQYYINFYVLLHFCVQWVCQSLEIILHLPISKPDSQTTFRKKPVYLITAVTRYAGNMEPRSLPWILPKF